MVSRYVDLYHSFNSDFIRFFLLWSMLNDLQEEGDINKRFLQLETKWIFQLKATKFPVINEKVSVKPFL